MSLLEDVKIRLELSDDTYDELLAGMIAEILGAAWEYMGMDFSEASDESEYFDGGVYRLYLKHANPSNVRLYVDGVLQTADTYTIYSDRAIVKKVSGTWEADSPWTSGQQVIRVVYDGGYEQDDDLPQGLRGKLIKQVTYEFRRRRDPGLASVTYPDGSINKWAMDEWLPDVDRELNRHRRLVV